MKHWKTWHGGVHTHFIPQWSCYHDPVLWAAMVVVQSAIWWHLQADVYPSTKHMWSCQPFCQWRHPCPQHVTWNLHPSLVDVLVDVHRRSCSFLLIHPREVFLAWCLVITRPSSSCGSLAVSPSGSRLDWGGAGTSVPYLVDTQTQGNACFRCYEEESVGM